MNIKFEMPDEDDEVKADFYNEQWLAQCVEDDEIDIVEEAFMIGYLSVA